MSDHPVFSLERRLVGRLAIANAIVLVCAAALYLWRGYTHHEAFKEGSELTAWFVHELVSDVAPLMIPLFAATLVVTVLTVRNGLLQIKTMSRQAAGFEPGLLSNRLPESGIPQEILPLISAINAGLERLAQGFETQKRFTASAAHELRTPLAILRARCSGQECPVSRMVADDISRMARIIDQLLAVARLETQQIVLDNPVELQAVCERVIADLYPLASDAGRDLGLWAEGRCKLGRGNDIVLGEALRNLVENALRLSPRGETVEIELLSCGIIRVLDHGPGVPDDKKAEIFQPFQRGAGSHGGGAGLGLCIAAEVVELHGGRISVMDRPGGGAIFIIDLSGAASPSD
ncbi:MAG: HAMP domain-containing histidine kinase [Rhodospirillales bacterium]|nr:MAG: HAMP domain-containing histidine kinase [Rhodospirillales bacterium]